MDKLSPKARYASAAVAVGALIVGGGAYFLPQLDEAYGTPFSYQGQQYFVRDGSQRKVYPSREECLNDVPLRLQSQCEPVSNYRSGTAHIGRFYGPVYYPGDTSDYKPSGRYSSEPASSANVGRVLPTTSSKYGFGATGKAHTSAKSFGG